MTRVLVVRPGPHFSVADVCRGWVDGLKALGLTVIDFPLDDRLNFYERACFEVEDGVFRKAVTPEQATAMAVKGIEVACYEVWPDIVLFVSGFFLQPAQTELMRRRGHRVVLLCTESPYEDDRQLRLAEHADVVLLNDPTNLERFRAVNPASHYAPHAYDPARHRRGPSAAKQRSDFTFVGTGYPSRIEFFEQVDWSGLQDVTFAGNWQALTDDSPLRRFLAHDIDECVDNEQTVALYQHARASANLYRREAERPELSEGWAIGPREVELAATGTFFLREPRGEGDELLPMLPTFADPFDLAQTLRWWLARPHLREVAANRARAVIADRTFVNNARRLMRLLDR